MTLQHSSTRCLPAADNSGYFVPESMDEARESIGRIASQGALMSQRARTMQAIANRIFGRQQQLL